jgi:hypothetical protein
MGLALTTALAICAWIVMWAVGVSGFDGLLLVTLVVLLAATLRSLGHFLPGAEEKTSEPGGW